MAMEACPKYASQRPNVTERCIFTVRTSRPGSHLEGRKSFFSALRHDGGPAAQFAEEYPSVSRGLETSQTIPQRRRTGLYAPRRGALSRYRKLGTRSR